LNVRHVSVVLRALGNPSRLLIYERLGRGEASVKELAAHFEMSQPAVSQDLAALRRAGLVSGRRQGRRVYYRRKAGGLRPLVHWIKHQLAS
jgi:DNA-binding transcriptional ArsR family regulator